MEVRHANSLSLISVAEAVDRRLPIDLREAAIG